MIWMTVLLVLLIILIIYLLRKKITKLLMGFYNLRISTVIDWLYNTYYRCNTSYYAGINSLKKYFLFYVFLFWVIFFIIYYVLPDNFGGLDVYSYFDIPYLYLDKAIKYILTALGLLFSISITILLFSYKQEIGFSLAMVSLTSRYSLAILFMFILSLGITYIAFLGLQFPTNPTEAAARSIYFDNVARFDVSLLLLFFVTLLAFSCYKNLVRNTNVTTSVGKLSEQSSKMHRRLAFLNERTKDSKAKKLFEESEFVLESLFQLLTILEDNNMDRKFQKEISDWISDKVWFLMNGIVHSIFKQEQVIIQLFKSHPVMFIEYYRQMLSHYSFLIMGIYKKDKIDLANNLLENYIYLLPGVFPRNEPEWIKDEMRSMREEYFTVLDQLAVYIYNNKKHSLMYLLETLSVFIKSTPKASEINGYLSIYSTVLQLAIDNRDLKTVVNVSHTLSHFSNFTQSNEGIRKVFTGTTQQHKYKISINLRQQEGIKGANELSTFILLLGVLKSIELSNHEATGFLIKFISNNVNSKVLHQVTNDFIDQFHSDKEVVYFEDFIKKGTKLKYTFKFNEETQHYCLKKLTLLLYSQFNYIIKNQIQMKDDVELKDQYSNHMNLTPLFNIKNEFLIHLFRSVKSTSSDYSLYYLDDDYFMNTLYSKIVQLKIKHQIEKKEGQQHKIDS
ncbi:hypothetical protein JSY36_12985 [Bacillus sp. H-16]|uniref:hypothetical protein n=1 Tax=Alteribacter salitolerans TaxID=2912333 RepID=UPI001963643E|nr:hypothetical protein [Alteribacter salitolerans]MBM7096663.1 hypothetical protein [Alteribacter salitolerans]